MDKSVFILAINRINVENEKKIFTQKCNGTKRMLIMIILEMIHMYVKFIESHYDRKVISQSIRLFTKNA